MILIYFIYLYLGTIGLCNDVYGPLCSTLFLLCGLVIVRFLCLPSVSLVTSPVRSSTYCHHKADDEIYSMLQLSSYI